MSIIVKITLSGGTVYQHCDPLRGLCHWRENQRTL